MVPRGWSAAAAAAFGLATAPAWAAGSDTVARGFLWIAIILVTAKLGSLVERVKLPAVLGEILVGVLLGNLALLGIEGAAGLADDRILRFLAELGAVILLFQIGLESSVATMRRIGGRASSVALIGVAVPFVLGAYVIGPLLLPGLSQAGSLFVGAALTATSVGITGRVFRDAGALHRRESQIVLGAAVIDDVLGLLILAVVSAIATHGGVDPARLGTTLGLACAFLVGALVVGQVAAAPLSRAFARVSRGNGMKLAFALSVCLGFAYVAHAIGLAPIVGAFAAGLILEDVHFRAFDAPHIRTEIAAAVDGADAGTRRRVMEVVERHSERHLETLVEPVGHLVVPIFFVVAGMQVKVELLADPQVVAIALAVTAIAVAGKLVAGLGAGAVDRWLVGWGMVPRGEVGLIFAFVGKELGVLDDHIFAVIVLMVIGTTLVTPPVLAWLLRRPQPRPTEHRRRVIEPQRTVYRRQRPRS